MNKGLNHKVKTHFLNVCMILTGTFIISTFSSLQVSAQSSVTIEERPFVLPTYTIAPADKRPFFFTGRTYQGARGEIYPYPMYDVLTNNRIDKTYEGVFLDNEYIQLCVVPELGGRILSALDKTDNYDFFYHQHVVKPALIGMIGAWMSGGVEWNIPDHHRASTMLPADYRLVENADGSKTVWVGETEYSRRMRWMVGLTVYPGKSYVEATVKLFNTSPFIQSFLYWANVSVHCDENYQVIFPPDTQYGTQHAKREFTDWNIGSGMYGGIDRTGVDLSRWKNHPNPASIFAWNFDDDFLAGYDFGKDAGTVHVANHHIVGGKKFFLWGNNPEAQMWEKMLTEKDGQYLELMVGAYSDNQPDYSWIRPGETREFKQIWYPVKQIGGVKNANRQAAVNLERSSASSIRIGFNATSRYPGAKVNVTAKGKSVYSKTVSIDPATPFVEEVAVDPSLKDEDIRVSLTDRQGNELISYQSVVLKKEEMPEPVEVPRAPETYASSQELYLTGLRIEQFRNARLDPVPYYEEALKRDSLDYLVNNVMGIRALKEGRYPEAGNYFRRSLKRLTKDYTSPKDVEAFYYKGLLNKLTGNLKEAKDALWKATWSKGFESSAYFNLAEIACLEHDLPGALELVNRGLTHNTLDAKAQTLKAYILRKLDRNGEAAALAKQVGELDNLYFWNQAELNFQQGLSWDPETQDEFKAKLHGNVQSLLELTLNYGNAGAWPEAIQLLDLFISWKEELSGFPLLYYYKGYFQLKNGDSEAAGKSFELARNAPSDYCFPFRLEEADILETAATQDPDDPKVYYYLGNLHYYLDQKERAIKDWEHSARLDDQFWLTFRNLGFAYNQAEKDVTKAVTAYEKAISVNPKDPGLFAEIDELYEQAGKDPAFRLKRMKDHLATVEKRDDATMRLLLLYNQLGYYPQALDILKTRHFHVWEGGGEIHDVFVNSCLLEGISEYNKNHDEKALGYFQQASTYPDNLEVGEPHDGGRVAETAYFTGKALKKLGKKDEANHYFSKSADWKSSRQQDELVFYKALSLGELGDQAGKDKLLDEIGDHARSLLNASDSNSFFSKFGTAANTNERMAQSHYLMGLSHWGKGELSKAQNEFEKAISLNPDHLWAKVYASGKIK